MKIWLGILLFASTAFGAPALWLTVSDSINPGTADYIASGIREGESSGAPYVLIQLDTPGGLLNTTRQIVQAMLNSTVPIVVWVGPQGAHAGSAGALITFAADIAAMAPGTNIGAAHPVGMGSEKTDKVMADKIANDVAAFAESLAKTKGRNTDWAIKAVRSSSSIIAEDALKMGVIDLMAHDAQDLAKRVAGFQFKTAKLNLRKLPEAPAELKVYAPTIKHKVVSFFADPNLAYLVLILGGLCIWVEVTHPGLIFPGVLGAFCVIISLVSFQALPIDYGALAMIILGMILIVIEMFVPSFGVLGIGGIVAFIFGSLYLMDTNLPEFKISLGLIFPTAATLAAAAFGLGLLVVKSRKRKALSGLEAMVGEFAEVREPITSTHGKVFVAGELWNAVIEGEGEIPLGVPVKVAAIRKMVLVVART